jgi:FkbM family methyltransferase
MLAAAGRRLVPARLRARVRTFIFQWLDITWKRPSGVTVRIANYADWIVYNEVFVDAVYDPAITAALDAARGGQPLRIVDLGANVGFFVLRVIDVLRTRGPAAPPVEITAVEANPHNMQELRRRIAENGVIDRVRFVNGLIGHRTGTGALFEGDHHSCGSAFQPEGGRPIAVGYVDLSATLADYEQIDLLKCDIEGAELLFIHTYPDLLRTVRRAVFELHHELCDTDACCRMLDALGFTQQVRVRQSPECSLSHVWR